MSHRVTYAFCEVIKLMLGKKSTQSRRSLVKRKEVAMSGWWGSVVHNLFPMYPYSRPHLKGARQHPTLSFPDYPAF